jgi:hypothetical protein
MTDPAVIDIARIIQLAIAPVFLIAGIGNLLNVLTSRLARVVDRGRVVAAAMAETEGEERALWQQELTRINRAITLSTIALLAVCLLISAMFAGEWLRIDLSGLIVALFIATMAALIAGLVSFLAEVHTATQLLRVPTRLLQG